MTGHCESCKHWVCAADVRYEDGSVKDSGKTVIEGKVIELTRSPPGKGECESLHIETPADFGCIRYFEEPGWDHILHHYKRGAPWQHSRGDTCPDCAGKAIGCLRCTGTGIVRYYDDGHIGEERTRLHPKERELAVALGPPKCVNCGQTVDPNWVACPWCGARTNKPSEREVIPYAEGAVQGTTDEMIGRMRAAKQAQAHAASGEAIQPGGAT